MVRVFGTVPPVDDRPVKLALVFNFIGCLFLLIALIADDWLVADQTASDCKSGLWKACDCAESGCVNLKDPSGDLQATRAFAVIAVIVSFFSLTLTLVRVMDFRDEAKQYVPVGMVLDFVMDVATGILGLIAVTIYVTDDDVKQARESGTSKYGWAFFLFVVGCLTNAFSVGGICVLKCGTNPKQELHSSESI